MFEQQLKDSLELLQQVEATLFRVDGIDYIQEKLTKLISNIEDELDEIRSIDVNS